MSTYARSTSEKHLHQKEPVLFASFTRASSVDCSAFLCLCARSASACVCVERVPNSFASTYIHYTQIMLLCVEPQSRRASVCTCGRLVAQSTLCNLPSTVQYRRIACGVSSPCVRSSYSPGVSSVRARIICIGCHRRQTVRVL